MLNKNVKYRVTFTAHGDVLRALLDAVHESTLLRDGVSDRYINEGCRVASAIRHATPILQDDDDGTPGI